MELACKINKKKAIQIIRNAPKHFELLDLYHAICDTREHFEACAEVFKKKGMICDEACIEVRKSREIVGEEKNH